MKRIIKTYFNFFFFLFGISLLLVNCSTSERKSNILDDYSSYDFVDIYDFPLYISLKNGEKQNVNYFVKYDYEGITINSAYVKLNAIKFKEFKEMYELNNYEKIIQVHLLTDNEKEYKNYNLTNESVNIKIVYYVDEKNNVKMDLIRDNVLRKTYNNISNISASVISRILISNSKSNKLPVKVMVMNKPFLTQFDKIHWSLLSNDSLYNELKTSQITSNSVPQQSNCDTCIERNYDDCSSWNPGVCGSICDLRIAVGKLKDRSNTLSLGNNLNDFFPDLYDLKSRLSQSQKGNSLIRGYYDLGNLSFSGQINVPLQLYIDAANIVLNNSNKISAFTNNYDSNMILYNSTEAQEYINFLVNVKATMNSNNNMTHNASTNFKNIIDLFIKTISNYQNKTINEINTHFGG